MLRVAVCDDNAHDLAHLRALLEGGGVPVGVTPYENAETLLWDVENEDARFDLYLLDIYLTGVSGLEAARRISAQDGRALLVFVSTSEEFFKDAFALFAFTYLVKPVGREAVDALLEKAAERLGHRGERGLSITYRGRPRFLPYGDIAYLSSANHSVRFHLQGGGEQPYYGKLDEIAPRLEAGSFVRCHQSYIVNLRHVTAWEPDRFTLEGAQVPISRAYADAAKRAYDRALFRPFDPR